MGNVENEKEISFRGLCFVCWQYRDLYMVVCWSASRRLYMLSKDSKFEAPAALLVAQAIPPAVVPLIRTLIAAGLKKGL